LLDVGQGLFAVVQTANHVLVYDTGAKFSTTSDSGQSVVSPFLRSQRIEKVSNLVVSYGDNGHIGGVAFVLGTIETGNILTSVPQQLGDYSPIQCKAGQSWTWDKVKFSILSPKPANLLSDNDNSCVLQIQAQHGTALLTGDIEEAAESWLVETYQDKLKADVLISPHYDSQTSSTSAFITAVQPDTVLIQAGYRNQFGHPHQDILQRYRDLHIRSFNNSRDGSIGVTIDNGIKIETWPATEGRYSNNVASSLISKGSSH